MIRGLISLTVLAGFIYVGATVELGTRTLFGHVANVWSSDEAQEMVEGVKEGSAPMVERLERGVRAGVEAARQDAPTDEPEPEPEAEIDLDAGRLP